MRIVRTSLIAIGFSLAATQPARADCCSDFWNCVAAVATGGLSCAVSAAIDELNNLKNRAEASRTQAQAEKERLARLYVDTANQEAAKADADSTAAANATQVAVTKVESSLQKLNVVVSPAAKANLSSANTPSIRNAPGLQANAGAAAAGAKEQSQGTPQISQQAARVGNQGLGVQQLQEQAADAERLKSEVVRARQKQVELKEQNDDAKAKMKTDQTDPLRQAGRDSALAIGIAFEAGLIAPIVGLVGTLPPPDPLLTAAIVAAVVVTLDRIEADGNAAVAAKARELDAMLAEKEKVTDEEVEKMKARQRLAEEIQMLVDAAVTSRSKADLDKLTARLGAPPPAPMRIAPNAAIVRPIAAAAFKPVGRGFSTAPAGARSAIQVSAKPVTIAPATLAQYKTKTEADIRTRLKATQAADTAKKRNELIAEARIRFAKDPATLNKVIAYLQQAPAQ